MNIDDLLNSYFEGETTAEEEQQLRDFFASGKAPQRLAAYKPLFAYFDEEIRKEQEQAKTKTPPARRKLLYWVSGIAATVLLLIGLRQAFIPAALPDPCLCSGNYVIINGRCYTDMEKARSMALEALQEVATPADAYFPGGGLFDDEE
jgi:hypothetical protein